MRFRLFWPCIWVSFLHGFWGIGPIPFCHVYRALFLIYMRLICQKSHVHGCPIYWSHLSLFMGLICHFIWVSFVIVYGSHLSLYMSLICHCLWVSFVTIYGSHLSLYMNFICHCIWVSFVTPARGLPGLGLLLSYTSGFFGPVYRSHLSYVPVSFYKWPFPSTELHLSCI